MEIKQEPEDVLWKKEIPDNFVCLTEIKQDIPEDEFASYNTQENFFVDTKDLNEIKREVNAEDLKYEDVSCEMELNISENSFPKLSKKGSCVQQ
ncbi:unnamed protein product [Diabrotica balteata]|uniref:Uncharacterized protein n=1 Tax=Diabrotica balteata TaxID=107213 RepID=A0A9N9STD7_DIABA|nr:unnamed protein product [Diabrotica balteata]